MNTETLETKPEVLAHRLWAHWSMHISEEEDISEERVERWREYWVPFSELPEDVKETDERLVNRYLAEEPDYPTDPDN